MDWEDILLLFNIDGLTLTSLKILFYFVNFKEDNGKVILNTQKELAELFNIPRSQVTRGIRNLIDLGLVTKINYDYYIDLNKIYLKKETD